ncbi:glycosyltransferase family 2 protein [Bacteroides cutis]|uniref:glycosyltransferase family 2 protein n=1 Tax=Bacteroides cutis TaxID=2024197 RepID=UPI000C755E94|nr:glycosyltransferase family 2 protein [Bacteroides cutis]
MEDCRIILSVICPVYNEIKYIDACIQSILLQDYSKENIEILFVDGMSTDGTRDLINGYAKSNPFIKLVDNPQRIVPIAMNIGIRSSKGDIVIRLDAHALYPTNYFSALVNQLVMLGVDNVGAACRTDVLNKNQKTLAIKEVLSNRFGVGNSTFRLGVDKVMEVDTVPFGCWRKEVFEKYGYYDERLIRNQDIELNKRIIRGGGHICIIPDTYSTYLARETFKGIAKNNYLNGKWNILTVFYTKQFSSLSIRHFVPLFFLLSLALPLFVSLFYLPIVAVALLSLVSYMLCFFIICSLLSIRKELSFFYLFITFPILHLSYGWGSFMGLMSLLRIK